MEAGCDQAPSTDSLSTTPSSCAAWTASIVSRAAFEASAPGNAFKGLRRRRCRSGGAKPGRWRQTSQHCVSACWGPKLQECPSSGAVGEGAPPSPRVSNPFRSPCAVFRRKFEARGWSHERVRVVYWYSFSRTKPEGGRTRLDALLGAPVYKKAIEAHNITYPNLLSPASDFALLRPAPPPSFLPVSFAL